MTGFGLRISGVGTNRAKTIARAIERNICFNLPLQASLL